MTITLKLSNNTKEKMIEFYKYKKREKTPPYAIFQADEEDTVVTLYESGKAVFQGISADVDAAIWKHWEKKLNPTIQENDIEINKEKKEKVKDIIDPKIYNSTSIGSDEVGTGDYFGPIVVTSTYVKKEDIPFLEELGVKDSKKLTDEKILEIVPKIIKKVPYKSIVFTNKEYNSKYSENCNMNKIKAILHNKVLIDLTDKYQSDYVVVDQFAKPFVYYNYLKDAGRVYRKITFITKAEDKCLSVACASMISRYVFLHEFDKLIKDTGILLPKGASNLVDEAGVKVVKNFGIDKLNDIAKLSFKNTQKIKDLL